MKNRKYIVVPCPQCGCIYVDWITLKGTKTILVLVCPICKYIINLVE